MVTEQSWQLYRGTGEPRVWLDEELMPAPPWRSFGATPTEELLDISAMEPRGATYIADNDEIDLVNAALYLRRPLFITGKPGSGKSSLAYAVAHELCLGPVLHWPITTRVTRLEGLYQYDAIRRLQDASLSHSKTPPDIGTYIRLGPLGTALLPWRRPRVLLIDELDKSDIDLPNDLLTCFEDGNYIIPEVARTLQDEQDILLMPWDGGNESDRIHVRLRGGRVHCHEFPFVIISSNGEREFPPAFLRRCLRLDKRSPSRDKLERIVKVHLGPEALSRAEYLVDDFLERQAQGVLVATDQLLNAIYLVLQTGTDIRDLDHVYRAVMRPLNEQTGE